MRRGRAFKSSSNFLIRLTRYPEFQTLMLSAFQEWAKIQWTLEEITVSIHRSPFLVSHVARRDASVTVHLIWYVIKIVTFRCSLKFTGHITVLKFRAVTCFTPLRGTATRYWYWEQFIRATLATFCLHRGESPDLPQKLGLRPVTYIEMKVQAGMWLLTIFPSLYLFLSDCSFALPLGSSANPTQEEIDNVTATDVKVGQ